MTIETEAGRDDADSSGGLVPGAFFGAFVAAAQAVELEPYRLLRQAGLPTTGHDDDSLVAPYHRFMDLVTRAAQVSGRADFPLLVLSFVTLSSLGAATELALAQPTLREALEKLCLYAAEPKRRMRATLEVRGTLATIRLSYNHQPDPSRLRVPAFGLGVALRAIQGLLGDDWRPLRAEFTSAAPAELAAYRKTFGEVLFDQPFDCIVFESAQLDRQLATSDPMLAQTLGLLLDKTAPKPPPFVDQVRELIVGLLPHGSCTIDLVADHVGVDRRTVHRRLAAAGMTFSELVDDVRRDTVSAQFAAADVSITEVAKAVGFANQSGFTRWFRRTYGVTPARYRKAA